MRRDLQAPGWPETPPVGEGSGKGSSTRSGGGVGGNTVSESRVVEGLPKQVESLDGGTAEATVCDVGASSWLSVGRIRAFHSR